MVASITIAHSGRELYQAIDLYDPWYPNYLDEK